MRRQHLLFVQASTLPFDRFMKRLTGIFIFLAALLLCAAGASAQAAPTSIRIDLGADGRSEMVTLDSGQDPALIVRRGKRVLWRGVPARWKPWKLMVADVDGDGRQEIIVGVYKATHYFPQPHNCLFIYGWDGKSVAPKWLGSTLSKPFTDFTFADLDRDGHEELVAVETTRDGRRSVAVYSWNGFGFTLDWQRGAWQSARLITNERGQVVVEADGATIALTRE